MQPVPHAIQVALQKGPQGCLLLQRTSIHIQEQRPRQRLILATQHLVQRRIDRSFTAIHRDVMQLLPMPEVSADTKEAQCIRLRQHGLDQLLFVLAGQVITAAGTRFAVDHGGEVIVGTGVAATTKQTDRPIRPLGAQVLPGDFLSLGLRLPQCFQLIGGDVAHPVIAAIDDNGDGVKGDGQLDITHTGGLTARHLLAVDRPRGIADVGFTGAKASEPRSGAGEPIINHQLAALSRFLGDGKHGAGTIGQDGIAGKRRRRQQSGNQPAQG